MSRKYRLGIAGMVHDHVWGELNHWKLLPNVEFVAAADPNPPLIEQVKSQFGVERVYESWQEMLEKEALDVLQLAATNAGTAEIVEAAAARGIHMVSEKPMAARLSQADRMLAASEQHQVKLMINWPNSWSPSLLTALRHIKEGAIGQPIYLKYRAAHNGPKEIGCSKYFWGWLYDEKENGAGALMDYCCYSANLNAYVLGVPNEVFGFRGTFAKDYPIPDDNAMIVMKYAGAFGVAEASWTQPVSYPVPNPICHGTAGCIYLSGGKAMIDRGSGAEAIELDVIPDHRSSAPKYLLHCIETGEPVEGLCSPHTSRNAQEILEAGLISADTGKAVRLPIGG